MPESRWRELRKILGTSAKTAREAGVRTLLAQAREKIGRRELHIVPPSIPEIDYDNWIARNEPAGADLDRQRNNARELGYKPRVSIITPVWNPPPEILADTLESVLSQTYGNWELCIVDGASTERIRKVLHDFAERDERIRVQLLEKNLGISRNSNLALQLSRGEFVGFLDHDDLLAPNALFEVAECLNRSPELDFIYSDMDFMSVGGKRFSPLFKPDWSPDIMLSTNYVTHLCVSRSRLVEAIGGFRPETDGAQDWDMFLRITQKTTNIHHIPKILYHWRQARTSVSLAGLSAKPYATRAQTLAVNQHLTQTGQEGEASLDRSGLLRVKWKLAKKPLVSIILFPRNGESTLQRCLRSIIRKSSYENYELIIVCHMLDPPPLRELRKARFVETDEPLRYSSTSNLGAAHAKGEILLFLDPRTEVVSESWLEELAGWALQPEVGAVGAKLLYSYGRIRHGGIILGLPGALFDGAHEGSLLGLGHTEWYRNFVAVSGACLATRREVFDEHGNFDRNLDAAADIEYCLRARKSNYRVVYTPHAKLLLHDATNLALSTSTLAGIAEYDEIVEKGDPYFNPNLSYDHTIPTLKTK